MKHNIHIFKPQKQNSYKIWLVVKTLRTAMNTFFLTLHKRARRTLITLSLVPSRGYFVNEDEAFSTLLQNSSR